MYIAFYPFTPRVTSPGGTANFYVYKDGLN
jgi:hypothetical protein